MESYRKENELLLQRLDSSEAGKIISNINYYYIIIIIILLLLLLLLLL